MKMLQKVQLKDFQLKKKHFSYKGKKNFISSKILFL